MIVSLMLPKFHFKSWFGPWFEVNAVYIIKAFVYQNENMAHQQNLLVCVHIVLCIGDVSYPTEEMMLYI